MFIRINILLSTKELRPSYLDSFWTTSLFLLIEWQGKHKMEKFRNLGNFHFKVAAFNNPPKVLISSSLSIVYDHKFLGLHGEVPKF